MFRDILTGFKNSIQTVTGINAGDSLGLTKESASQLALAINDAADFSDIKMPKAVTINCQFDTTDSNDYYSGPVFLESLYNHFGTRSIAHTLNLSPYQLALSGNDTQWSVTPTTENVIGMFYRITPKVNTESNRCSFSWYNNVGAKFIGKPENFDMDTYLFIPRVVKILTADQTVTETPGSGTIAAPNIYDYSLGLTEDTSHYVYKAGPLANSGAVNLIQATNAEVWTRPLYLNEQGVALAGAIIAYGMTMAIEDPESAAFEAARAIVADLMLTTFSEPDRY